MSVPGNQTMRLLSDDQIRQFIADGVILLKDEQSEEFHKALVVQLNAVCKSWGNPGNNLIPIVSSACSLLDDPVVRGALTSVLGPDYMVHAHRSVHENSLPMHGHWHRDNYWGYQLPRAPYPWWIMIMYFPQDTPKELGPTEIMPGTYADDKQIFADNEQGLLASGPAGTFALIHYDIWHRTTPNRTGSKRYMLKFIFRRMRKPGTPSWNHQDSLWIRPNTPRNCERSQDFYNNVWNWMLGMQCTTDEPVVSVGALIQILQESKVDQDRFIAALSLAMLGPQAAEAVPALCQALHDRNRYVRAHAAEALKRIGTHEAKDALIRFLGNAYWCTSTSPENPF